MVVGPLVLRNLERRNPPPPVSAHLVSFKGIETANGPALLFSPLTFPCVLFSFLVTYRVKIHFLCFVLIVEIGKNKSHSGTFMISNSAEWKQPEPWLRIVRSRHISGPQSCSVFGVWPLRRTCLAGLLSPRLQRATCLPPPPKDQHSSFSNTISIFVLFPSGPKTTFLSFTRTSLYGVLPILLLWKLPNRAFSCVTISSQTLSPLSWMTLTGDMIPANLALPPRSPDTNLSASFLRTFHTPSFFCWSPTTPVPWVCPLRSSLSRRDHTTCLSRGHCFSVLLRHDCNTIGLGPVTPLPLWLRKLLAPSSLDSFVSVVETY